MTTTTATEIGFWNLRSCRLYLTLIFGFAVLANALIKNTLSMAIVCMVNKTAVDELNVKTVFNKSVKKIIIPTSDDNHTCQATDYVRAEYEGPFVWTSGEQGFLFSALFIGGLISTIPSGFVSDRFNPKAVVAVGLLCSSLGSYLTPVTANNGGYVGVFVLRLIMGFFGQAIVLAGISSIGARWMPPTERSTMIALYSAGNQIANIVGMPLNAFLCQSKHVLGGWPLIFYVNGTFGLLSCVVWIIFVTNRPDTNKFISDKEKDYIAKCLSNQNLRRRKGIIKNLPWVKMLTSPVVLTCFYGNFIGGFFMTMLMTYLPTYFKEALFVNLKTNGLFSALPYVSQWISKIILATAADSMKKKTKLSHTLITKCFNTIGTLGPTIFLIACAYMDCTRSILAVAFLSLANAFQSGVIPGRATSLACIAPAYTGIIGSFARFVGHIGSCLAPFVVSLAIVEGTAEEWRIVFLAIACFVALGGLLFIIFGSAEIQEWAKPPAAELTIENDNKQKLLSQDDVTGNNNGLCKNGHHKVET